MRVRGSKKGYTLVEVAVALAVAAVMFASMAAIIAPVYKVYARTRTRSDAQLVAGTVLDSIRATCSNARSLTALPEGLQVGEQAVFTVSADGYLLLDSDTTDALGPDKVLGKGVYNGKTIGLATAQDGDAVSVTVRVYGDGTTLCEVTSTVRSMRAVIGTPLPAASPNP